MTDGPTPRSFEDALEDVRTDGGEDAPDRSARSDAPRCPDCSAILTDLLTLPGGRVVRADSVPFSDAVAGVDADVGCPDCLEPHPDAADPGGSTDVSR